MFKISNKNFFVSLSKNIFLILVTEENQNNRSLEKSINNISRSKSTVKMNNEKKEKELNSSLNNKEEKENLGIWFNFILSI